MKLACRTTKPLPQWEKLIDFTGKTPPTNLVMVAAARTVCRGACLHRFVLWFRFLVSHPDKHSFSEETVASLLDHMFSGERVESVMVNGLSVIQTLLEFRKIG